MGVEERKARKEGASTEVVGQAPDLLPGRVRVAVVEGPDRGREVVLGRGTFVIGKSSGCDLVLNDPASSRRHLEIAVGERLILCRDLGSTNGSLFNGVRFGSIEVPLGARVAVGRSTLAFLPPEARPAPGPAEGDAFGEMVGHSPPMREVFALGARAAESDLPLLITGETGTGKEICAAAIHGASARRDGPFVVCDLGGLSRTVIENELFGHVRGAFTGADHDRSGSFPAATGGTILIDEIGELERDLQPRLLRAIERREIKPVGSATYQQVDVRVIAATQVDLEAEVAAGRFRRDLYHRLAVLHLELPPLRARKEDIPRLVRRFVDAIRPGGAVEIPPDTLAALGEHDWPGNVRELRNVVERALTVAPRARRLEPSLLEIPPPAGRGEAERADVPFHEAKEKLVSSWERGYLADLLRKTGGSVAEAARRSGVDRAHLYRLLKKHGLIE